MAHYRILVVEDEPIIAIEIENTLNAMGCEIVGPVARLSQAIALASDRDLDCAVLDVNVRGGSITPVAELLLARGVPLLLTTGYSEFALPECLVHVPRLTKPYSNDGLVNEVRRLCEQS